MVKRLLCLQHDRGDGPALIEDWALATGHTLDLRTPADPLPDSPRAHDLIVILGGRAGANDADERLHAERRLARAASESGVPVLGLCLGAQMLAVEFGGDVVPRGAPEHGWTAVDIRDESLAALFGSTRPLVFGWHNDAIVKPPEAALLASSPTCAVQAFRIDQAAPVLALQFHLEADADKIALFRRAGKRDGAMVGDEAAAIAGQRMALAKILDSLSGGRTAV
jgi:GMP synthase-like glutamine amidotransferase